MKHLAPTLAVLACVAVPAMGAEDFSLKISGIVQARALLGNEGTNQDGDNYDPLRNQSGNAEYARFGVRRARIAAAAKTSDGWFGNMTIRSGEPNNLSGSADSSSPIALYYAYIGRTLKSGEIEHELKLGLDKSFNGESSISSSTYLFPQDRVTASISDSVGSRAPGFSYRVNHEYVRVGVDVMNNTTTDGSTMVSDNPSTPANEAGRESGTRNGLRYSTRVEGGLLPAKKMESFAGAPGTHVVLGFEMAKNNDSFTAANTRVSTTIVGPDLMVHVDGLSFLAEYRARFIDSTAVNATNVANDTTRNEARFWAIVAGYAIPTESGIVFEPAVRAQFADVHSAVGGTSAQKLAANGTNPAITSHGEFNGAQSGKELGVSFNTYWNGHKNKTQVAYTRAQAAEDQASASFFTIQQQITF